MTEYRPETYGDVLAATYDALYGDFQPMPEQLALLRELAAGGVAVEVGSGTGRVALPLAAAGVEVVGVDASAEMTRVLKERAASQGVSVDAVHADAASLPVPVPVSLVFAVFNTFFLLASERTQAGFLGEAARVLAPTGRLVIETFVPHPGRQLPDGPHPGVLPNDRIVTVKQRQTGRLVLFAAVNDPASRRFDYHEVVLVDGEPVRLFPGSMRYCWPHEVDTMAAVAGLTLAHRWGEWDRRPFTARSGKHVSVYRPAQP